MANRYLKQFGKVAETGIVTLDGYISIGGVDGYDVVSHSIPEVKSVTHSGTGQYTITLVDSWPVCKDVQATFGATTAVDLVAQNVSNDVVSAKTVVIRLVAGATPTDPAAPCGIHVKITLKNSFLPLGQ